MRFSCVVALLLVLPWAVGCGARSPARSKAVLEDADQKATASATQAGGERGADDAANIIESPLYTSWLGYPVGTTTQYKEVTAAGANQTVTTITYKLVERTDARVVIEFIADTKYYDGHEAHNPPEKLTNPRYVPWPPGKTKLEFGKPEGLLEAGEDTVVAAGKEYQTKWYYAKGRTDGGDTFTRTWTSEAVPGGLVKSVYKVPARGSTTTLELVAVTTP
jgi:hypothetical protein